MSNITFFIVGSKGLYKKIEFLKKILCADIQYYRKSQLIKHPQIVAGKFITWGYKQNLSTAFKIIKTNNLRLIRLEDGFLRSYASELNSQSLSIITDSRGLYYNSYFDSDLEKIIVGKINYSTNYIEDCLNIIISYKLSKYTIDREYKLPKKNDEQKKILVVDQTFGDLAVKYGASEPKTFIEMLEAAHTENPEATIYIKTHPEVTSDRKKGYLTHIQVSDRIVMIREDVNPIDLIQKMDKVYVVTSQMGFEALMCGKTVVCFGVPWYAGWGVTDDRVKDSPAWARRSKKRTVDELFAAAYLHYTRYLNPFTHERGTIFDVIEWLVLQKKMVANQFKRSF